MQMADHSGVSFVLHSLNHLLEQDVHMLNPKMEDQIRSLRSRLRQIIPFCQAPPDNEVVSSIACNVIHEAELTIHAMAVDVAKQRMRSRVGKFFHVFGYTIKLREASANLERIIANIQATINNELIMSLKLEDVAMIISRGSSSSNLLGPPVSGLRNQAEEDKVLGFQDQVKDIVTMLTNKEPRLQLVPIVGEAGSGKTTLARKVYNNGHIKRHFRCRAWVQVSQHRGLGDLLRQILEAATPTPLQTMTKKWGQMEEKRLMEEVSKCFQGKKYLIVMDDLRGEELWVAVKAAFLGGRGNGSRILLTTRPKVVAADGDHDVSCHHIRHLDDQFSWKLLAMGIGGVTGGAHNGQDLEAKGREMAKKCKGSPLSIQLLSGILATKEQTKDAWSALNEDLTTITTAEAEDESSLSLDGRDNNDHHVLNFYNNLLNYNYKGLAHHLRFCFLYFGMFPAGGVEIPVRQLIQLWMAEGFIQHKISTTNMEDVGEEYLEELIGLRLIQVAKRRTDGGVKACRIRDIFQEFCISKGKNSGFFEVSHPQSIECGMSTQRLAVHAPSITDASFAHFSKYSGVRSFQLSIQDRDANLQGGQYWSSLGHHGFKLLRVLNMGFVCVNRIPSVVGKLIHLRYLKIKSPGSKHVPPSICNLLNLQTLDLRESSLSSMPDGIWKLQQLRHLHLSYLHSLPELPANDKSALKSLQTLSAISTNSVTKMQMVREKFPNLRRLKLFSQSKHEMDEFLKSIDHLFHLQSLKIVYAVNDLPHPNAVNDLPHPNAFPLTLTKIALLDTCLCADGVKKLERLPNLRILKLLRNSIGGEEINCSDGAFSQLQVLHMVELETLTKWSVLGEKAMGSLRHLVIRKCVKLRTIPDQIYRPNLKEVDVYFPSANLRKTLRKFTGVKGCDVRVHPPQDLVNEA